MQQNIPQHYTAYGIFTENQSLSLCNVETRLTENNVKSIRTYPLILEC